MVSWLWETETSNEYTIPVLDLIHGKQLSMLITRRKMDLEEWKTERDNLYEKYWQKEVKTANGNIEVTGN